MSAPKPHNLAGLVETRKNRATGSWVSIYRAEAAGIDASSGRYAVVCEAHGSILNAETLSMARRQLPVASWCEDCRAIAGVLYP